MAHTFVIAEAGSCHCGQLEMAHDLVDVAAECGADAVKFQWWSSAQRLAERRHAPELRAAYEAWQVPEAWLFPLSEHAARRGLAFMCTAFLPEDVAVVAPFVRTLKVASFEAEDEELLRACAVFVATGHNVVVSCGMATNPLVAERVFAPARAARAKEWQPGMTWSLDEFLRMTQAVRFLHCVSAYPAPVDQLSLRRIRDVKQNNGRRVFDGFSDHSPAAERLTGALAVSAGATVIERHLKLDATPDTNPDAPHAMVPAAFDDYVAWVRLADAALGDDIGNAPRPCEEPMLRYRVRR